MAAGFVRLDKDVISSEDPRPSGSHSEDLELLTVAWWRRFHPETSGRGRRHVTSFTKSFVLYVAFVRAVVCGSFSFLLGLMVHHKACFQPVMTHGRYSFTASELAQ